MTSLPTTFNAPGTVLVLGGRGRFGLAAVQAFSRNGWRVLAQIRPGAKAPEVKGVQWLAHAVDCVAGKKALIAAAQGATVVVHALNPTQYTRQAWARENGPLLEAGMSVAQALHATLMLPGNVYNFGESMPPVLMEGAPYRPSMAMGRIRTRMEEQLEAATQRGDLRAVILRAGNFYGQGQGTWLDLAMLKGIRGGKLVFPGPLDVATPWAYLPDLAQTFVELARMRLTMAPFESLHFAGHTLAGNDWVQDLQRVARQQGWLGEAQDLQLSGLPWPLLRLLGPLVPSWAALASLRYLWMRPHRLDNRRLLSFIGQEPHTPWPLALGRTLQHLALLPAAPAPVHAMATQA
jgi:nucleoside-diphosphate-sugar epimerase